MGTRNKARAALRRARQEARKEELPLSVQKGASVAARVYIKHGRVTPLLTEAMESSGIFNFAKKLWGKKA